jgi:amino acid adenylation domain-containing protein
VTPGQEQVWCYDQPVEDGTFHTVPLSVDITGPLDRGALTEALMAIVRRHEPLRTSYAVRDNELVALISPDVTVPVGFHDLGMLPAAERIARAEAVVADELARRIELSVAPLRVTLLRLDEDVYRLVLFLHQIAVDGASVPLLQRELLACYDTAVAGREPELPGLPVRFRDIAVRSREGNHTADVQHQQDDLPEPVELPGARTRPARPDFAADSLPLVVPADLAAAVRKLARDSHSSSFTVLLTAFSVLLHRLTGVRDLVIGAPSTGRADPDTQDLIGYFVDLLPLRIRLGWDTTPCEAMDQVRDAMLTARDTPFHSGVRALGPNRDLDRHPVCQLAFASPPPLAAPSAAGGCMFAFTLGTSAQCVHDLEMQVPDGGHGELRGWVKFRTSLYNRADVQDLLTRFVIVLRQVTGAPDVRLSNQSLLDPAEHRAITRDLNANATDYPAQATLVELFHQVVDRYPDDAAVEFGDLTLTYRELDQRANRLAHRLPAAPIGVFLERGVDWVVAVLAILKAGGAYLPLDRDYPADRIAMLCADTGAGMVVTDRPLPELPSVTAVAVTEMTGEVNPGRPHRTISPDDLAYVMYTSGSTGKPKGVCVTHRNVIRLVRDADYVVFEHGDRVAQASTTTFDAATFEVWGALLSGGCLVGLPKDVALNPAELGPWLRTYEIDVLLLTTALAMHVAREAPSALSSLRYYVFGGEQPDTTAIAMLAAHPGGPEHIVNGYGPTETTTFATSHRCNGVSAGDTRIPLGRPLNNSSVHVVDGYLEPVPPGVVGELCIGGDGVARGYVGAPELTAERFVPDHLGGRPGARMYRTGDLARLLPDGTVDFLGRIDRQVKIRGFRIEPGEVEAALRSSSLVRKAVVVPRTDGAGDARLVGYVVLAQRPDAQQFEALREYLRGTLPDYLVPSTIVALDAFPLTRNGKLDLRALPEPAAGEPSSIHSEPRTPTERQLAEAWQAVLGAERIGRDANFYDLGGHSLKATRLVARIASDLGIDVPLRLLFDHPTIAGLAAEVERLRATTPVHLGAPVPRTLARSPLGIGDLLDGLDHAQR